MLFAQAKSVMLPEGASTFAETVDSLFYGIFWISVFFFVLITILLMYFVAMYHRRGTASPTGGVHHNLTLELTWTIIPVLIVVVIFYEGFVGYFSDMRSIPVDAYEIRVSAQKWGWNFTYKIGSDSFSPLDGKLHIPSDKPVKLVMTSGDVIHSLYVPAFRAKMDIVPGRVNTMWFQALPVDSVREFPLYCAEYCGAAENAPLEEDGLFAVSSWTTKPTNEATRFKGKGHSGMFETVVVHPAGTFEAYLNAELENSMKDPVKLGESKWRALCSGCHSVTGLKQAGPSFKGSWGEEHEMADGSKVKVDEAYVIESIKRPAAKVRAGFSPVMPSFDGQLSDKQINGVIEFIKSLK